MIKTLHTLSTIALLTSLTTPSQTSEANSTSDIQHINARLEKLERQNSTVNSAANAISDKLDITGVIEFEGAYTESVDYSNESESEFAIATVEIGIAAYVSENIHGNIVLLYEDGDSALGVDVATLTFSNVGGSLDILLGKEYVPFGTFETSMVNGTLISDIAETHETIIMAMFGVVHRFGHP